MIIEKNAEKVAMEVAAHTNEELIFYEPKQLLDSFHDYLKIGLRPNSA